MHGYGILLINLVRGAPTSVWVCVSMACVDETVLERSADVVSRQTSHRGHHIPRELSHLQGLSVLTSPPVVLCSAAQKIGCKNRLKELNTLKHFLKKARLFCSTFIPLA